MTTLFFSIDVESSDTDRYLGNLLSVGGQLVVHDKDGAYLTGDGFYTRIDQTPHLRMNGWFDGSCPTDTYKWWVEQNAVAQDEAWRDLTLHRVPALDAAIDLANWVTELQETFKAKDAFFVANPVAFDKGWIDDLFSQVNMDADVLHPFHYRSLCLRSMRFGLRKGSSWGSERDTHVSKVPHHPLEDAIAQALDLVDMLKERDG